MHDTGAWLSRPHVLISGGPTANAGGPTANPGGPTAGEQGGRDKKGTAAYLVVLSVQASNQEVVGDVVQVASVLEPGTRHADVVGCALALHLDEDQRILFRQPRPPATPSAPDPPRACGAAHRKRCTTLYTKNPL